MVLEEVDWADLTEVDQGVLPFPGEVEWRDWGSWRGLGVMEGLGGLLLKISAILVPVLGRCVERMCGADVWSVDAWRPGRLKISRREGECVCLSVF